MKVWNAIFNLIAVLMIAFIIILINNLEDINRKNFEEVRLAQATDYANEGAFRLSVESDSIGTDYADEGMDDISVNPGRAVEAFSNIMCLSYNMQPSEENKQVVKQSLVTGVMFANDGYYILEEFEVYKDTTDAVIGGEFELKWGLKRPYIVYTDKGTVNQRMFAVNLISEKTIEYVTEKQITDHYYPQPDTNGYSFIYRSTFENIDEFGLSDMHKDVHAKYRAVGFYDTTNSDKKEALSNAKEYRRSEIAKLVTNDLAIAINARNIRSKDRIVNSFYLPSTESLGISDVKSPTMILIFQDSTELNGFRIDSVSVGGHRVRNATKILGFYDEVSKQSYYCYAGQQPNEAEESSFGLKIKDKKLFNSIHEAAMAGYKPHMYLLQQPYGATKDE